MDTASHPLRRLLEQVAPELRTSAFTHPAWSDGTRASFERLEFLGDAVLGLAVSAELFRRFPERAEGELSRIKAALVSRAGCGDVARDAGLGDLLRADAPPTADQRLVDDLAGHERVLAALTESAIGVIFLTSGFDVAAQAVIASLESQMHDAVERQLDAKSTLQEYAQARGDRVEYLVTAADGPDHDRTFVVQVALAEAGRSAEGAGTSKKRAEQAAAQALLAALGQGSA